MSRTLATKLNRYVSIRKGIRSSDLKHNSKDQKVLKSRNICMYVLFTNTRLNFKDISGIYNTGSYIVSQAVEKINCESGVDKELRDFIKTTEKELGLV